MLRFWCALLVGAVIGSGSCAARADSTDELVRSQMKEHRIPGVSLVVIQDDRIIRQTAYGLANVELNVATIPETVFEIGSITKQFTAACILLLVEDRKLSLEDRISKHLHWTPASWSNVTVRHLLTHTSGIKSYTGLDGFELRRHLTQEQFIKAVAAYPLEFQPGDNLKYCNTGYNLLGFIIENLSGGSYWSFLKTHVLDPLGMSSTGGRTPSLIVTNRAAGYEQTNNVWINRDYDLTDVFSAGAIVSTTGDLARWNNSLDTGALLTAESRQQMWTPARLNDGTTTEYGLGWRIEKFGGRASVGHGGATSGFSASLQRFPEDRLAVIVLTNTDEQIATKLAREIAGLYVKK